jgi:hypothetical protein
MFSVDGQQVNCKLILCEFDSHLSMMRDVSHCGGIGSHNTLKMYCFYKRISSSLINDI